jgi:siroheme synthase
MRRAEKGKVYLVGSGMGNPELLMVRAVRLLETADVVFHDDHQGINPCLRNLRSPTTLSHTRHKRTVMHQSEHFVRH